MQSWPLQDVVSFTTELRKLPPRVRVRVRIALSPIVVEVLLDRSVDRQNDLLSAIRHWLENAGDLLEEQNRMDLERILKLPDEEGLPTMLRR